MKRNMDFFGTPERKSTMPRVQCHVDGISVPGLGSMRLCNIPKNLWKIGNLLVTLGQKASSILFYGFTLGVIGVKGDNCREPTFWLGKLPDLYLNHTQQNAFLWIKYGNGLDPTLPSECNFSVAEKQPGDYIFSGCACSPNPSESTYRAFLYGQNLTMSSVNCVEQYLQCPYTPYAQMIILVTLGSVSGGILLCCLCCYYGPGLYRELNHRREIPLLMNPEAKRESLNPVFIDDAGEDANQDRIEQQLPNSSWCCFRR